MPGSSELISNGKFQGEDFNKISIQDNNSSKITFSLKIMLHYR